MSDSVHDEQQVVRPVALILALVGLALLLGVIVLRQQPPPPQGADTPSDQFSAGRVQGLLKEILAEEGPHWAGSASNRLIRQRIISVFERLGYAVEVQEKMVCRPLAGAYTGCSAVQNILTRLPGSEPGPALLLVAHYDSVPAGPGMADDGQSVASLLELARILKEQAPHHYPIVFLIDDAEEIGSLGAVGFVEEHPWARDVAVVLNLEARGTAGRSLMFETSVGNGWLVDAYAAAVRQPASSSLYYEIYRILPNYTDLTVFRAAGMAGMNFAFIDRVAHYHTPLDSFANLALGSVQHQGASVLAVVQALVDADLSNPSPSNAAWTDVLGLAVVRWPAAWTLPLALLALLLLLGVAARLMRRHALTPGGTLVGLLAAVSGVLASVLLGLGLTWIVSLAAGTASPWYAYPLPMRVSLWAAALLATGLAATAVARRARPWELAVGAWCLWALLALALSIFLPGAAIVLLLPTLVAGVIFATVAFSRLANLALAREITWISAALAAGVIGLPLALSFETAVSFDLSPTVTFSLGLVACTLAPIFVLPQDRTWARRGLFIVTAGTLILATILAARVSPFSPSAPQQVNLLYFAEPEQERAYWSATSWPGDVPEPLRGHFAADLSAIFPWYEEPLPVTDAPSTSSPAPELQITAEKGDEQVRVVELQLRSPRGADWLYLHVPVEALASVAVAGYTFPVSADGAWNGYYTLECSGSVCDGLVVELSLNGEAPVEVLVNDVTAGLPPGGEVLIQDRPPSALPAHWGDQTIIMKRVEL